jgi:hypothetical protein
MTSMVFYVYQRTFFIFDLVNKDVVMTPWHLCNNLLHFYSLLQITVPHVSLFRYEVTFFI